MTSEEWQAQNDEADRSMTLLVFGVMAVIALFVAGTLVVAWMLL